MFPGFLEKTLLGVPPRPPSTWIGDEEAAIGVGGYLRVSNDLSPLVRQAPGREAIWVPSSGLAGARRGTSQGPFATGAFARRRRNGRTPDAPCTGLRSLNTAPDYFYIDEAGRGASS